MYTAEQIAGAVGAPLANVAATWPAVVDALRWQRIDDHATQIAMAATIAVETGVTVDGRNLTFLPVRELGGSQASYAPWYGRGLIQCTWESNYATYGPRLAPPQNLLADPDILLQTVPSAQMAALYFADHGIQALANQGNWQGVRTAVNGGLNGWPAFIQYVTALAALPDAPDVPPLAGRTFTVVTRSALKVTPDHESGRALGPGRQPTEPLPPGTHVIATGKETPHWREFHLMGHLAQTRGWLLKDAVRA